MDRQLVYTGSIPQTGDILKTNKAGMIGLGYALQAFLGPCSSPVVDGLAIAPTIPATLSVTVSAGSIHSSQVVDQNSYGDLGIDTTHTVVKQGILQDPVTLTVTPPGTAGYSQNYLVQVAFSEVDGGSVVLPYYNAANPSLPFAGPNNAGTSNYTVRQGTMVVQLKAGTAASTGSQTTPAPDAGFVGLYVITVANGATSITAGNITTLSTAPFIPTKLPTVPSDVQSGKWSYGVAGGTANALAVTLTPQPASWAALIGAPLNILVTTTNTSTAVTFSPNGLTAKAVVYNDGSLPQPGDLTGLVEVMYNPTLDKVQIVSFSRSASLNAKRSQITAERGSSSQLTGDSIITRVTGYSSVVSSFQGGSTFSAGVMTVGAADAGLWLLSAHCRQTFSNVSGLAVYLYKNSAQIASDGSPAAVAGSVVHGNAARAIQLAAGDTVDMRLIQTTGADFTFNDLYSFSAVRIGA